MSDQGWDRPLESGLRDDYNGTILKSYFGTDARYQNGQVVLLKWDIAGQTDDGPFEDTVLISIGANWSTLDGGATIVHDSGKDRYFTGGSHYGKVIARVTGKPEDGGLDQGELLASRGNPFQAKVWEGLKFHFTRESFNYGGEIGTKEKLMPTAFLGAEGGDAPAATTAPAAPAAVSTGNPTNGATPEPVLRAKLTAAAKSSADFAGFLDAAMAVEGVLDNDALMAEVVDEAQFYASANA